ncbi:MAG: serine/threonine protein kinase [Gemmatimonadaceae bacterium]|nr:serine/threonine protein kinase [Gemmatimonadaceae bacterium]
MDRVTWQRVEAIGAGALERTGDAREQYLTAMCAGDAALEREVRSLLAQLDDDPQFLETSVLGARPSVETPAASPNATAATHSANTPRTAGSYTIQRALGEGGMGHVFLASRDVDGIDQTVALKMIRPAIVSPSMLQRFRQERRILAALEHPHIARFIDAGVTADDHPYVAMEYVDGEPITTYCTARGLRRVQRLQLFLTVCDAVQHAHQRLVVHRDLKPSNILVTAHGTTKLLDFGIGKLIGDTEQTAETQPDTRLLTPDYAAPEQLDGGVVTTATDVYALGLLLFELLTGRHPFKRKGMTRDAIAEAVRNSEPLRLRAAVLEGDASPVPVSELRGDLETIVAMALQRDPSRRYASVTTFAEDIRRYLLGLPVTARADSVRYRLQKFVRRHTAAVIAAAAVLLAVIAVSVVSVVQSRRVRIASVRASAERDQALEVRSFLMEMFGATGADQSVGDTLTVRALLDKQRATIESAYTDRPQAKADMLEVLADGYDRLGYPIDAEPLATSALALRRANATTPAADLAGTLNLAGWIAHERGRSAEAEPLLLDALRLRRTLAPPNDEALSRTLNDLGVVYNALKRYDEAERVLREALSVRRAHFGDSHRAVGITANNLAAAYFFEKRLGEAVETQALALRSLRASVGNDHQRTVVALANLATFKRAQGDLVGAESDYRALVAQQSRLQGRGHPVTARVMSALALTLSDRAARASDRAVVDSLRREAESLYVEAIAAMRSRLGATHPQVATTQARLDSLRARRRSLP